jgi:hypothetical protein
VNISQLKLRSEKFDDDDDNEEDDDDDDDGDNLLVPSHHLLPAFQARNLAVLTPV